MEGSKSNKEAGDSARQACFFFSRNNCKFGSSCKNLHDIDPAAATSSQKEVELTASNKSARVRQTKFSPIVESSAIEKDTGREDERNLIYDVQKSMRNYRKYFFDMDMQDQCMTISNSIREERKSFTALAKGDISSARVEEKQDEPNEIGNSSDYNIVVMRHAMSEMNFIQEKYHGGHKGKAQQMFKQHFRYFLAQGCEDFFDTPLHPLGVQQCRNLSKRNSEIPYKIVFVSPLRRTMQTCIETFKEHPQRESIKFFVFPGIAEVLKKDSDVFLSSEFQKLVDEAATLYSIVFDCNTYFHLDWQFNILKDSHVPLKRIDNGTPQLIKSLIEGVFPQPIENFNTFVWRVNRSLEEIRNIQKKSQEVVGIITHSLVAREFLRADKSAKDSGEIENLTLIFSKNL